LYNLTEDRCETDDRAAQDPERVRAMADQWQRWARRVQVIYDGPSSGTAGTNAQDPDSPVITGRALTINANVVRQSTTGVIVAQGGREQGYAVHLLNGRLAFDVRVDGEVTRIIGDASMPESFRFQAELNEKEMVLSVDGRQLARGQSPGLIPVQPKDPRSIGRDELSAAGDYLSPNPLQGQVTEVSIEATMP
jgi:arylsulfatase